MSITNIKTYFRTHLDANGFSEWTDAFNVNNIPSNILDKAYHIQFDSINGEKMHGENQTTKSIVLVRMFFKGFRNPNEGIDTALSESNDVILDIMKPTNRFGTDVKNTKFLTMSLEPVSDSNDNSIVVTSRFEVTTVFDFQA
jgi:hypothetical protein